MAYNTPRGRPITAAIERRQDLGGIAAYAALGVELEPAETGQLAIHVPDHTDGELLEQARFGLTETRLTLARELGPGHLALTHAQGHDVDSSSASFATTATALAFVLSRSAEEIRAASAALMRGPCRFQMTVGQVARIPESLCKRSGVHGVVLAGPYLKGDLRVGDHVLVIESRGVV